MTYPELPFPLWQQGSTQSLHSTPCYTGTHEHSCICNRNPSITEYAME